MRLHSSASVRLRLRACVRASAHRKLNVQTRLDAKNISVSRRVFCSRTFGMYYIVCEWAALLIATMAHWRWECHIVYTYLHRGRENTALSCWHWAYSNIANILCLRKFSVLRYSRLQKSCNKQAEQWKTTIVLEQRGRACWGGKDNQIHTW